MDSQLGSAERQFLEAIALECGFTGDTREAFLGRFDQKNASKTHKELAKFLAWNKDPVEVTQKLQDELGNIFDALEACGCTINRHRGRAPKGQNPWKQAYKWLWESRFPEWLKQNQSSVSNSEAPNRDNQPDIDKLMREVRDRCCNKILTNHNYIQVWTDKILERLEVEQLFVPIFVFPEPGSQRESRQKNQPPEPVMDAVSRYQHLLILGKPGAGKSTLANRLALICCKEEPKTNWIPVLLRLSKTDPDTAFNLIEKLGKAFNTKSDTTQQILESGKVFLILDGLDEAPKQFRQNICQEIINFSEYFYKNKVIITCRTEAKDCYKKLLSDFDHVEISDFDSKQQNLFIEKWFTIKDKNPRNWLAMRLQEHPECKSWILIDQIQQNGRVQELAKTPILLSLICLVYVSKGKLPEKRSHLYKQGLEILLEDWDHDRGIENRVDSPIYKSLNADDKCKILAELARYTFDQPDDAIAFEEETALEIIRNHQNYSPQESREILEGIAADHGLVFRSSRRKWEFSHLTFQEYFVAQWFVQPLHQDWKTLAHNVCNPRWREVILLSAEMAESADELLRLMKDNVDDFLAEDDRLQEYLSWAVSKAVTAVDFENIHYKHAACRAFYLEAFDLLNPLDPNLSHDFAMDFEPSVNPDVERRYYEHLDSLKFEIQLDEMIKFNPQWESPISSTSKPQKSELYVYKPSLHQNLTLDYLLKQWLAETQNEPEFDGLPVHSLACCGHRFRELIPLNFDPLLEQKLQTLFVQIQDYCEEDWVYWKEWWNQHGKTWAQQLREAMIVHRNVAHDWQFSDEQKNKLQQYDDANKLLVDCLKIASYKNSNLREEIEETLLLPIAELENRQRR